MVVAKVAKKNQGDSSIDIFCNRQRTKTNTNVLGARIRRVEVLVNNGGIYKAHQLALLLVSTAPQKVLHSEFGLKVSAEASSGKKLSPSTSSFL